VAARLVELILPVVRGHGLEGDDALPAVRGVRAALHGFVALEQAGGFGMPQDVDTSFAHLLTTLDRGLRHHADTGCSTTPGRDGRAMTTTIACAGRLRHDVTGTRRLGRPGYRAAGGGPLARALAGARGLPRTPLVIALRAFPAADPPSGRPRAPRTGGRAGRRGEHHDPP
jgi:WHG domain-containing protein